MPSSCLAYEKNDAIMGNRFAWGGSLREGEKGSELPMSVNTIMAEQGGGRCQSSWQRAGVVSKITGSVRWQCLRKSNKAVFFLGTQCGE